RVGRVRHRPRVPLLHAHAGRADTARPRDVEVAARDGCHRPAARPATPQGLRTRAMSRLRRLLRPRKDEDFAREVEAHLAMEIEDQIARGVSPEEARAAALRAFGNPTRAREDFRERSPWFRVDTLWQDVQ